MWSSSVANGTDVEFNTQTVLASNAGYPQAVVHQLDETKKQLEMLTVKFDDLQHMLTAKFDPAKYIIHKEEEKKEMPNSEMPSACPSAGSQGACDPSLKE